MLPAARTASRARRSRRVTRARTATRGTAPITPSCMTATPAVRRAGRLVDDRTGPPRVAAEVLVDAVFFPASMAAPRTPRTRPPGGGVAGPGIPAIRRPSARRRRRRPVGPAGLDAAKPDRRRRPPRWRPRHHVHAVGGRLHAVEAPRPPPPRPPTAPPGSQGQRPGPECHGYVPWNEPDPGGGPATTPRRARRSAGRARRTFRHLGPTYTPAPSRPPAASASGRKASAPALPRTTSRCPTAWHPYTGRGRWHS